uniref:C2H2-type domain-containing protein n=1 Tax=Dicentrarchus labrax TaxID=13489 RepID=A0A8C4H419_DICLA
MGPSLPLSALRLLVPPIRLVSAAIWQTVEQKIVSDYGLLEEFVFMVTEIVPQLLSTRQRAELILGLRARVRKSSWFSKPRILEVSPNLQSTLSKWCGSFEVGVLHLFMTLYLTRMNYFMFQDVFPGDFGPTYDKAIQTLMWLFLSRLEKLLPTQTLQVVIVNEQAETDAESGLVYTVCTEMEVESENKEVYMEGTGTSEDCAQTQWFGLGSEVKAEMDSVVVTDPVEGAEASESEVAEDQCPNMTKAKAGRKAKEQDTAAEEGEQSSSGVPCEATSEDQPLDNTVQDPDYSPPAERSSKDLGQKSPEGNKSVIEGPFYCPHCSVEFKNICYTECDECDKAFKYKSTLDSHKQTHNPLYCEVCMKLVRDPEALAMHKESHTPFQCNQCVENFPVFKALHKHYIDVHNPTEPFTCTHCQTTFASLKRFIRHEWKHTGYQPFQCPHCSKRFRSYSDLVEHQKKHTKAYPFLCWECGKKFRHGVTLTRHVERVHHTGEPVSEKPTPTFTCAQCGKTFTSRRCLLKHDNFHHKGLRFPCEHCGKGFFGKDALVRHTLIHTGERPFKCDDCDKSFRSAAELKIHRRYHTGERPFKCNVCEKGFVQSCFLTLHMRTHTGERPYVCTVCTRGFTSLHGLKRHRRLVHA